MARASSYHEYGVPSAILSDGILTVPLWAVASLSLSERYKLPPVASSTARAIVATHQDTVSLSGVLVGRERYAWKLALETLADVSKRGGLVSSLTGGRVAGLILVTAMTIRTDMQVESLEFRVSSTRRDVIDVTLQLAHMPLPGAIGRLLDTASLGIAALADWAVAR
jgi:hypothetical protein